ncbi:MAG: hypothetical protein QNK37_27860 [Acidobacteriota bacterium]|nr:hypothetical protein [Acidobacteriota bacterium]
MLYSFYKAHFTPANKYSRVLFFLICATVAQAAEPTLTRFASDRVVQVTVCFDHEADRGSCWVVTQRDHGGDVAPRYHLHGSGNPMVSAMAINSYNEVLIAGSFSDQITLEDSTLKSSGGVDLFYLLIDSFGEVVSFGRLGGPRDEVFFGVEYDAAGQFMLQGAESGDRPEDTLYLLWHVYPDGHVEAQNLLFNDLSSSEQLDDDDDAPVEDPIGKGTSDTSLCPAGDCGQ